MAVPKIGVDAYDQPMTATEEVLESIDGRLRLLKQEIDALSAARAALNGNAAPATSRPRKATATKPANRREPDAPTPVSAEVETEETNGSARTPARPARKRRAKPKPATQVAAAGKLEVLLSASEGLTTAALAERASADRDQVLTLLREMETAGRVRRTGQRRSTRWHTITDEERIQQRAAELAAQSRAAKAPDKAPS
jgi:hypothetical protein